MIVAVFHASFDASINQLPRDVVQAPNRVRFLIISAAIPLPAATVIIATQGSGSGRAGQLSKLTQTDD